MVVGLSHASLEEWIAWGVEPWASRASFGVGVLDEGGRFRYVNEAMAAIHGVAASEHYGRVAGELLPHLRRLADPLLERALRGEAVSETVSDDGAGGADGARAWSAHQVPVQVGGHRAVLSLVCEVTAERRDGAAAIARNAFLKSENELLTTLANGIAHDLRSPLAATLMQVTLARRALAAGDVAGLEAMFDDMEVMLRHGADMAGGLVRLAQTMRIPRAEAVCLEGIVEQSWQAVVTGRPEKDAWLSFEGELPIVLGDESLLRDVFQNLFENAVKYGREGVPVRVCVSGRTLGGRALVRVADNGRGVPEHARRQVMQGFVTGDGANGSGLGLAIVERIVQMHDGRMTIERNEPAGAVFVLDLVAGSARGIGRAMPGGGDGRR